MGRFITKISFIIALFSKTKAYITMNSMSINFYAHQKQTWFEKRTL
jgi:hypothetical protein